MIEAVSTYKGFVKILELLNFCPRKYPGVIEPEDYNYAGRL